MPPSSVMIAYAKSISSSYSVLVWNDSPQSRRAHFQNLHTLPLHLESRHHRRCFLIHSWVDPPRVYSQSLWRAFHFWDYQSYFDCHPPLPSRPSLYPPFRVHPTRGDGHRPFCVDQPRISTSSFPMPTTPPCPRKPTSTPTSADTLYRSQSHQYPIQRGLRIFGGNLGPDRCPLTQ